MLGIYILSYFFGSVISGRLGGLYEYISPAAFWTIHAAVCAFGGIVLLACAGRHSTCRHHVDAACARARSEYRVEHRRLSDWGPSSIHPAVLPAWRRSLNGATRFFVDASKARDARSVSTRKRGRTMQTAHCARHYPLVSGGAKQLSEICAQDIANDMVVIDDEQRAPFVERRAGMGYAKPDHVANPQAVGRWRAEYGVLIEHVHGFHVRRRFFDRSIWRTRQRQRLGKVGLGTDIPPAQRTDDDAWFGQRLHMGPDLQRTGQSRAKRFDVRLALTQRRKERA